ncbi:MAG: hypothetical protein GX952_01725 [Firmicutes bacterium]|nr:hypothetical protein [Bacillota bacterium]
MTRGDVFVLGIILGVTGLYFGHTVWRRWLRKWQFKGAKRSEEEAANLLERQGFQIVSRQPTASSLVYINGKPRTTTIRADFIVKKGWRKYVVEVKSGHTHSRLTARTRRQLLEYQLAFRANSILLVNMNKKTWQEISFCWPLNRDNILLIAALGIIIITLGGIIIYLLGRGI